MVPPDISVKLNGFQSARISKFQSQKLRLRHYIFLGQSSIPMAAKSLVACKRESDKCRPSRDLPKYRVGLFHSPILLLEEDWKKLNVRLSYFPPETFLRLIWITILILFLSYFGTEGSSFPIFCSPCRAFLAPIWWVYSVLRNCQMGRAQERNFTYKYIFSFSFFSSSGFFLTLLFLYSCIQKIIFSIRFLVFGYTMLVEITRKLL